MGVRVVNPRGVRSFTGSYVTDSGFRILAETIVAFGVSRMVYLSFLALITLSVPIAMPAPGRFTGTTGTMSSLASSAVMVRSAISVAFSGARGITSVMGPLG